MRILTAIVAAAAFSAPALGQTITERGDQALDVYRFTEEGGPVLADAPLPTGPTTGAPIYDFKTKSVAKAFALSLLVPGAGQFYTGSKLKGIIFLGVEALGWVGYFKYDGEGDDLTAQYEQFARTHWVEQAYWDSLNVHRGVEKWHDDEEFPHHLPYTVNGTDTVANLNHEYYENIGKYDQFVWGWDDLQQIESPINSTTPELSFTSARRYDYVAMREDANKKYDHARAAGIVLIANHLVSALEAAFSAKRYNSQAQHAARRIDVDLKVVNLEDTPTPWVRVAYSF